MGWNTAEVAIVSVAALGGIAMLARLGSAAAPAPAASNTAPGLPGSVPPGPMNVQARPFASGWTGNPSTVNAVNAIERAQLASLGFSCDPSAASCLPALQTFASANGMPDPTGPDAMSEDAQQALAYALDDKYRMTNRLPLAASGALMGPRRHRGRV